MGVRYGYRPSEIEQPSSWTTVTTEVWWEQEIEPWTVMLRLVPQDSHAVIAELRMFPSNGVAEQQPGGWNLNEAIVPEGGLRAKSLQDLHLRSFLQSAREELSKGLASVPEEDWIAVSRWGEPIHPLMEAGFFDPEAIELPTSAERRPGRAGHPIEHYLRFAVAYDNACRRGSSRPNVDAAAELFGVQTNEEPFPDDIRLVQKTVKKCRQKGLLKATGRGLACGSLTDKALQLLKDRDIARQSQL